MALFAHHPPWRRLLVAAILAPILIALAVLAFAWPAARVQPRNVPVGVVGSGPSTQRLIHEVSAAGPGAFDFRSYRDVAAARSAIDRRQIYGAFVVSGHRMVVLEASAASPTMAQVLSTVGAKVAAQPAPAGVAQPATQVSSVDIVPLSRHDPRGIVFSAALLPLTICGVVLAVIVALALGFRPAWRQIGALSLLSALAGLTAFVVAQSFLGALPHDAVATWAALSLTVLAMAAACGGVVALVGAPGVALVAVLMVFVGNPSSGATSAPEMLPGAARFLGELLPPGAGASLLRSTAYFDGTASAGPIAVLVIWSLLGFAAVVAGHHSSVRFAGRRAAIEATRPSARHREAVVAEPISS